MTRTIDFSKPLTEDEQRYVSERPWLLKDAHLRGEDIILDEEFVTDLSEREIDGQTRGGSEAPDEPNDESDSDSESDETDSDSDSDEDEDEGEDADGESEEDVPYSEWDYADLKQEAKALGLSPSGSKEQIINRLEEYNSSTQE